MSGSPKVYDVRKVHLKIGNSKYGFNEAGSSDAEIEGIAEAGFGITPSAETTIIMGLKQEVGFSVDPSSGAEASVTLKSTSDSNRWLRTLLGLQRDALADGTEPFEPLQFIIEVEDAWVDSFGFKTKRLDFCVITKWPEFATNEKEAPDYEWGFVGYGYKETSV